MRHQSYQRAIITGASSGLGEEFAYQLAPYVDELILIARRRDRLTIVGESSRRINPALQVSCLPGDLTDPSFMIPLIHMLTGLPSARTLLINNAGMGDYGEFSTADWDKIESMIVLNIFTLTKLCHSLIPTLETAGGGIINISSLASALPIPDFAVYAASKAYVLSLSEALRLELKEKNINVLAVCPGPVHTEFGQIARRPGFTGDMMPGKQMFDTSRERVVSEALSAMAKNKSRVYPGGPIKWSHILLSLLPAPVIRWVMGRRPRRSLLQT